jgi:hypothetical protein
MLQALTTPPNEHPGAEVGAEHRPEGCEVTGSCGGLAQPRVEGIEVVVVMLGRQLTVPAHAQADLANRPAVDQIPRQVGGAVGRHGDAGPHGGCLGVREELPSE